MKRVHAGIGARNGIEAADLARVGITGPRRYLTGNKGFYKTFVRKDVGPEAAAIFAPTEPLHLKQMWLKAYCCCAANHAYIDLMMRLQARVGEIDAIEAGIQSMTDACVGIKNEHRYAPRNIEEMQYSLPVQMALAVLGRGNGYATHKSYLDGKLTLDGASDVIKIGKADRVECLARTRPALSSQLRGGCHRALSRRHTSAHVHATAPKACRRSPSLRKSIEIS